MRFDKEVWRPAAAGNHASGRADWQVLRARLAAAYATHTVLERAKMRPAPVAGGSFDRRSALALAVYGRETGFGLDRINPTALGNGKPGQDNDAAVAGAPLTGDRG